ncbi:hypothetical protein [uncultured Fusobacterium sp.]|uniref:major outer membrane protein FomA n=2 Tax=uncultured Fusobacterium sp. TaxID=159267 RepID=UPI0025CD3713|nr:hypothetical protein [uncultured Fusobacterium sp.]
MRKLALLLGSLVVVASASAKEVVPAPVVVEEAPVQIVEKEVIVYRDKEEGFRPNGYVDLQYRYYGDTEGQSKVGKNDWNKNNDYGRLQLEGTINTTENQSFYYRVRTYDALTSDQTITNKKDELKLQYNFDHGNLGDSKVNFVSRLQYVKDGSHALRYEARFDFAEYMFNNDFIKTTEMVVAPYYEYTWNRTVEGDGDNYDNELGFYANFVNELPYGFAFQVELDTLGFHNYGDAKMHGVKDGNKDSDSNTTADVNIILAYGANLYSNEKMSVDFSAESGYDSYSWSDKVATGEDHETYSLKTDPKVTLTYHATPSLDLYATAGAEYRNWKRTNERSASNWRWQPFGIVGFRTTF